MTLAKSPYNFVPAPVEDQVFKPDWAKDVSHDIPFEDGESGEIEIEITAETPIFIRDGHKKPKEKEKPTEEFSHFIDKDGKKQYFIPATSLKGMARNVLEIMSFSRLAPVALGNTIFGLRDMNNEKYSKNEIRNSQSGWLIFENNKWVIKPCVADKLSISSIKNYFSGKCSWKNDYDFREINAIEKYKICHLKDFNNVFKIRFRDEVYDKRNNYLHSIYELDHNGKDGDGFIVMYGGINNKKYEYIFDGPDDKILELSSQDLIKKMDDMEEGKPDSLWNYFIKELNLQKIPVFYKEINGKVIHFGFSKLYRLNNAEYLKDLKPLSTYPIDRDMDLGQTIFGQTSNEESSLKGRVYFSHALATGNPKEADKVSFEILGSPKPSYYPFYLKQSNPKNGYNTYQNNTSELRGFKKYHVKGQAKQNEYTQEQKDSDSMVYFKPLESGAKFTCKLRYHNLKPLELGALLSALTYHNNHDQLRHNLGMAKSMGYGRIKMDVKIDLDKLKNYLKLFETEINKHSLQKFNKKWVDTDQIKDLGSLAKVCTEYARLNFPKLEVKINGRNENEFNNIKKMFEFLKAPSEYSGSYFQIKSLV
ncbi:MAG: TIGR03986 family type III CRISPR-associated RAMP protein [Bacteroidota bacterium]